MRADKNRRTVKKRAAAAGRFRFIEKNVSEARLCEPTKIEEPLKTELRQQVGLEIYFFFVLSFDSGIWLKLMLQSFLYEPGRAAPKLS